MDGNEMIHFLLHLFQVQIKLLGPIVKIGPGKGTFLFFIFGQQLFFCRKNRDVVQILALVIIGMFIPFLGSLFLTFHLDLTNFDSWMKIGSTFGYFLLILGIELLVVFLYFK